MGIRQQDQSVNGVLLMELFLIMLPLTSAIIGYFSYFIIEEYLNAQKEKWRIQKEIEQLKLKCAELENGSR